MLLPELSTLCPGICAGKWKQETDGNNNLETGKKKQIIDGNREQEETGIAGNMKESRNWFDLLL